MAFPIVAITAASVLYLLWKFATQTTQPRIKGLPEIPGLPFLGSLVELGNCHARKAAEWSRKYGPVFQVRLGNKRIIFANTYDSVKELWITQQSALISRPQLYTFHSVVSSSQGFTIGSSPWDASCKARRKAAATALNRPAVASYMPIIDLESSASIREMLADSNGGAVDINPNTYFQRFALNTSLTLNYGYRIEGNVDAALLKEITEVERLVSNFRSTSNNWQDYVPALRWFAGTNRGAGQARVRRDRYMTLLLEKLKEEIAAGIDKPCITGNIIKDPEAKLNDAEIKSICLTMVSAGLDTVPGNLIMGLAYLSSPQGQPIQRKAFEAIQAAYPDGNAWEACLREEKVPYVTALVKEVLRYYTVVPISLPRVSIKDVTWNGTTIPAGSTFYMNAYAADHDSSHFISPSEFSPERYLSSTTTTTTSSTNATTGTPHFGYGAGTRMCAGSHLANRELYTAFLRLLTAFEVLPAENEKDWPELDPLNCSKVLTSLTTDPKDFKVRFRVRDEGALRRWLDEAEARTRHF